MVAYRGTPDDYAEWQAQGAAGWGWDDVLPYYRKLESDLGFRRRAARQGRAGADPPHQGGGLGAAGQSGAVLSPRNGRFPFVADMNADFRDGYGSVPMSNWPEKRASAAICYLDAGVRAPRQSACHARGLRHRSAVRRPPRARASPSRSAARPRNFHGREIIVALGGIHSPAFLMRAGIGPAAALRALGIAVRADLPGVGENLSNHAIVFIGLLQKPGTRQAAKIRPHPMTAFRYSSGLPGAPPLRHVYQRAMQNVVEPARASGRQSGAVAAQADGARPRLAGCRRSRRPIRRSSSISPATNSTCGASWMAFAAASTSCRTMRCGR